MSIDNRDDTHLICLDIDGTLVGFDGKISPSAERAVRTAQKNGHKVIINTGRVKGIIHPFLFEFGFDGIVAATGAYIEYNNKVLLKDSMTKENYTKILDCINVDDCSIHVCTHQGAIMRKVDIQRIDKILYGYEGENLDKDATDGIFESLKPITFDDDIYGYFDKYKEIVVVNYIGCKKTIDQVNKEVAPEVDGLIGSWLEDNPYCAEITLSKYSKGTAIKFMCDYLNIPIENTVSIGDTPNDIPMIKAANTGIAMGNAYKNVKESADFITDTVDNDGVYKALKKCKLI